MMASYRQQLLRFVATSTGSRSSQSRIHSILIRSLEQQQQRYNNRTSVAFLSTISNNNSYQSAYDNNTINNTEWNNVSATMMMLATAAGIATACTMTSSSTRTTFCEESAEEETATTTTKATTKKKKQKNPTKTVLSPAVVAKEDFEQVQSSHDLDNLPVYTAEELAVNDGTDGKPVWMSYGGIIYDVTNFIANHPGGSSKIMLAAGSHIEPFWYLYRQHYNSDLPLRLMEHMAIGQLASEDQDAIDEQVEALEKDDPYAKEPLRHASLLVHADTPMNAEVPTPLITQSFITPASLFYIRHHHPVPLFTEKEIREYTLDIDLSQVGGPSDYKITLDELKKMPKTEIVVTLQCSGNRRSGYNYHLRTSGTPWGQGAISTSKFGGVRIRDILQRAGLTDPIEAQEKYGMEHVIFESIDGMSTSIGIEKAVNYYGDCIVAYEMDGEPLSREHGFPIRNITPGYSGIRNVKWLKKIVVSKEEADSPFNRGINYKILPPGVVDANNIDLSTMPSVQESSLFSGITQMEQLDAGGKVNTGDVVHIKVAGWAWAGGGRNIVRVDLTGDEGVTWATATLGEGKDQKFGRAWAWTFWEGTIPVKVREDGTVHIASKAVDSSFNVQPESCNTIWNFRGLCNNSWYRAHIKVI